MIALLPQTHRRRFVFVVRKLVYYSCDHLHKMNSLV